MTNGLSSRQLQVIGECMRCARFHPGSDSDCFDCSICFGWHDGDHCDNVFMNRFCRRCGEKHLPMYSCPCARCYHWHDGADCQTILSGEEVRPNVWRFEMDDRPQSCSECHIWHDSNTVCDDWRYFVRRQVPANNLRNRCVAVPHEEADMIVAVHAPAHSDRASDRLDIGSMNVVCPHCAARFWPQEKINCCFNGSLHVEEPLIPDDLRSAILSPAVRQHLRSYNMAMAMASVGHRKDGFPDGVFVLSGRSYHRMGVSVVPAAGASHNFAQIYLLDTDDATNRRMEIFNDRLNRRVLKQLHDLMLAYNPFVSQFKAAAASDAAELVWSSEDDIMRMTMGAIVSSYGSRAIVLQKYDQRADVHRLQYIDDGHSLYHTLAYPLLFPVGNTGWHHRLQRPDMSDRDKFHNVTLTDYGRYILMHRDPLSHLKQSGSLALECALHRYIMCPV
jgi:hypothetical protein